MSVSLKSRLTNVSGIVINHSGIETGSPPPPIVSLEHYGANSFYKHVPDISEGTLSQLTIYPYNQDNSVGVGNSRVTYQGGAGFFNSEYIGKTFCAYVSHKHPTEEDGDGSYFPAYYGAAYSTVLSINGDGSSVIVDKEYNGGYPDVPINQNNMSGVFFFDNSDAIKAALDDTSRPYTITVKKNSTYGFKKAWGSVEPINFKITTESGASASEQARLKYIAEDGINGDTFGEEFIDVGVKDNVDYIINVHMLPPIYTIPTVQSGLLTGVFKRTNFTVQWEGNLTVINSDDWLEFNEFAADGTIDLMPQNYSFCSPSFIYGTAYGGKRSGDLETDDVTAFVKLQCLESNLHAKGFSSLKVSNLCTGLKKEIIGKDLVDGKIVNSIVELGEPSTLANPESPIKLGLVSGSTYNDLDVKLTIANQNGFARLTITTLGSWLQVTNQYLDGSTALSLNGDYSTLLVPKVGGGDWELRFRNRGDFIIDIGWQGESTPIINGAEAQLYEQIPEVGYSFSNSTTNSLDKLFRKNSDTSFSIRGVGLQVGDKLTYNSTEYTILSRTSRGMLWEDYDPVYVGNGNNGIHYWDYILDIPIAENLENITFTVSYSQTEYLLSEGELDVKYRYDRDLNGHLFYDDHVLPYHYKNVYLKGYHRGSQINIGNYRYKMTPTKAMGGGKIIDNAVLTQTSPNSEMWISYSLRRRANLDGLPATSYPIEIKGSLTRIAAFHAPDVNADYIKLFDGVILSSANLSNPIIDNGDTIGYIIAMTIQFTDSYPKIFKVMSYGGTYDGKRTFGIISSNQTPITIQNYTSEIDEFGRYGSFSINEVANGFEVTEASGQNHVTVIEGNGALKLNASPNIANQFVNISNWEKLPAKFNSGIINQWDESHIDYPINVNIEILNP